ncbi:HNH endonuclease [Bacillus cereus]|nr:HNH endonuclease [Bacillus cereus]OED06643.1 hypothetical protein A9756_26625 [Bacillus cereus]
MAEFTRRRRFFKYRDPLCKKYLRIDFQKKCAYCGIHEAEIPMGLNYFQIDHFKPQKLFGTLSNNNDYDNLVYSCGICNGPSGKGDSWHDELLDPCKDNIYNYNQHIEQQPNSQFKLLHTTSRGLLFIETLKLNQKNQRDLREIRFTYKQEKHKVLEEAKIMIQRLKQFTDDEVLLSIRKDYEEKIKQVEDELIGPFFSQQAKIKSFNEEYEDILIGKLEKNITISKEYEDFDLDFKLEFKDMKLKGYLRIIEENFFNDKEEKMIRFKNEQIESWEKIPQIHDIIIFLLEKQTHKIYFSTLKTALNREKIKTSGTFYTMYISKLNELTSNNVEEV